MGRVVHFEIHADDPERAARFYTECFGWAFQKWEGPTDYWVITTGPEDQPGIHGGLVRRSAPVAGEGDANAFVCIIDVEDIDAVIQRINSFGVPTAVPKLMIPGIGWIAYFKDTEGNVFGIRQADPGVR